MTTGPVTAPPADAGQASRLAVSRRMTQDLRQAIAVVGIDEFSSQEMQFDQDSRLGRELLYLIANDEWSRATREIVTLEASDSVPTSIQVHVDLGRISHEAFRNRVDRVWLPLAVLPPPSSPPDGAGSWSTGPRIAPSPTVRDRSAAVLPSLPQSQARRWIAAAMSEIILNITPTALGGHHSAGQLAREQRLLLSAAIYRLLRQGSDHSSGPRPEAPMDDGYRRGRIQEARGHLIALMDSVLRRLDDPDGPDRSTLLIRRAARVLHAISSPTTLVVVAVEPEAESAVFTVSVPARPLTGRRRPLRAPRAEIELNLLLPAVDADRAVVINLPEGVSFVRPRRRTARPGRQVPVRAAITVARPRILWQIDDLLGQLDPPGPGPADPVARSLVDFTLSRMDIAHDAYRNYRTTAAQAADGQLMADLVPGWDRQLHEDLQRIRADQPVPGPAQAAREAVRRSPHEAPAELFRTHESDAVSPRRAHIRIPAVENRNVRGTPLSARATLQIAADDSTPLRAARHSGFMSLLLLIAVLVSTQWWFRGTDVDAQVLASVLTLFAAIQAGRIQSPDRSTLRGLLISGGSWVIVASVLPPVLLGVALAFGDSHPAWIYAAALGMQVLLQLIMYAPAVTGRVWTWSRRPSLRLRSDRAAPDHERIDVLHSSWWRSTTAASLLLGANAHGFVLPQQTGSVGELLGGGEPQTMPIPRNPRLAQRVRDVRRLIRQPVVTQELPLWPPTPEQAGGMTGPGQGLAITGPAQAQTPANILAMLRAGAVDRSLTFVVFREEPQQEWQEQVRAQVELDVDRLIAHEAPIGNLDVFIGLPVTGLQPLASHPLRHLLALGASHQLLILDVQFPVPPPLGASTDRSWTRTRIGLRGDEVGGLASLLTDILEVVRKHGDADVDLLVDTSTQTPPRRFLGTPTPVRPDTVAQAMPPSALNVVDRVLSPPGARDWLTVAMCDYATSGAEARILTSVANRYPELELAGLNAAILHGTCVVFALGHQPGIAPGRSGARDGAGPPRDGQLLAEEWTTAASLGQLPDDGLLLEVRAQYSDRPGLFAALVGELGERLAAAGGHAWAAVDLRLTFVHTEVADGRNATTWFVINLPRPAAAAQFDRLVLDRIERAARRVLAAPEADDPAADNLGMVRTARAVVSLEVVTVQPTMPPR